MRGIAAIFLGLTVFSLFAFTRGLTIIGSREVGVLTYLVSFIFAVPSVYMLVYTAEIVRRGDGVHVALACLWVLVFILACFSFLAFACEFVVERFRGRDGLDWEVARNATVPQQIAIFAVIALLLFAPICLSFIKAKRRTATENETHGNPIDI